jgi:hypothetical protein
MYTIGLISQDLHSRRLLTFWREDAGYRVTSFTDEAAALHALRYCEVLGLLLIEHFGSCNERVRSSAGESQTIFQRLGTPRSVHARDNVAVMRFF